MRAADEPLQRERHLRTVKPKTVKPEAVDPALAVLCEKALAQLVPVLMDAIDADHAVIYDDEGGACVTFKWALQPWRMDLRAVQP